MDGLIALGAFFLVVGVLLVWGKAQRMLGVFFMLRSNLGIRFIDYVAGLCPGFWRFLADYSVLLSFGGLGAYYLSSHRQSRGALYGSVLLSGALLALASAYAGRYESAVAFIALSLSVWFLMSRLESPLLDAILSMAYLMLAFAQVFDVFTSALYGFFGLPAVMVYLLSTHGLNIVTAKTSLPGISPMLPSERGGSIGVGFPGYDLFVPWWHALIALFITLAAHEGAHGIMIRVAKVRLKSTGVLTLLTMPIGAFVEPDDEELKQRPSVDRMRVYTVGSFANLIVGLAAAAGMFLLISASSSVVYSDGMRVVGFMDGYPAKDVLKEGSVIYSVDGVSTTDLALYRNATGAHKPGDVLSLETSEGRFDIKLMDSKDEPGKAYMGVYLADNLKIRGFVGMLVSVAVLGFLLESLGWVAFFNINIALVNLLPIVPFDGGGMFKELLQVPSMSEAAVKRFLYASAAVMGVLFVVNVIPLLRLFWGFLVSLV